MCDRDRNIRVEILYMYFIMRKELNRVGGIINRKLGIRRDRDVSTSLMFVLNNNSLEKIM